MIERDSKPVQSLERGLIALELAVHGSVKPVELAKVLGVDRSTAYRLLYTLMIRGFLEQDPVTREFFPNSGKLFALSRQAAGRMDWPAIANTFLRTLRDRTGETANLGILQENDVVYIAQQQTREAVVVNHSLGERRPAHCSALGKALLAFLPEDYVDQIVKENGLVANTPRTITDPEILRLHLRTVRELGYATDDEETLHGVRCVAAPIYDHNNRVIAAMGITGPNTRLMLDTIPKLAHVVVKVANETSTALGAHQLPLPENNSK
jgi:IclR family transcriptional regulator, KDG regulon repressor